MLAFSFNRKLFTGFITGLLLVIALIFLAYRGVKYRAATNQLIDHTFDIIGVTYQVSEDLTDAEIRYLI